MARAVSADLQTFTKSDGATLSYRVLGSGASSGREAPRTLVCHPGGPGMSGGYFGDLCGLGSKHLRVVVLNPRGTASSSEPVDGRYELADYAADVDELRVHLELERIDLLGHSHGGFVGMVYALSYPEQIGHLVLVCSAPHFGEELSREAEAAFAAHRDRPWFENATDAQRRRQAWDFTSREELSELYAGEARLWFADDAAADAFLPEFQRERPDPRALHYFNTRLAASYDMRPQLSEIRAPTLILNGAADFFGPLISARELSAIPDSHTVILPNAGHFAFVEAPERFRAELEDFLRVPA
jgi:proline iminopeptidase